jgi:ABC-type multidrug transport system permease subunit
MAAGAADTMNLMQTAVYEYRAAMPFFSGADEYAAAYGRFCAALVTDALMHSRFIETPAGAVDPYQAQLASLILFIICFGASMHAAALTARGIENGELRRLRARGVTFAQLLAAKLAGCAAVALPLCLVTSAAASAALPGLDVWRAMAASAAVTAASAPICLMISLLARKARHTAMASSAAMLLCLFTGGGFYPAYLMNLKLLNFNPAYMNAQLAAWALGGAPPEPLAYSCAALSAACVAVSAASFKMEGGGMMRLGFTRATGRAGA